MAADEKQICDEHKLIEIAKSEKPGLIDRIMGRVISRKFFVFLTSTGLFIWNGLDPDTWGMIAMIYIGGQSVIDAAISWKHGK